MCLNVYFDVDKRPLKICLIEAVNMRGAEERGRNVANSYPLNLLDR